MSTSSDGTSGTVVTRTSSVAPTVTDGATLWIRTTLDVNNDAGGNDVKFWTSLDGNTWTQLGTTITNSGTAIIHSGTGNLEIGSQDGGANNPAKGKIFRAQILNGIDGTIVLDADASVITLPSQTTFVDRSSNAYTVTINKSGVGTFVSTGNYLYLPGVASNYASAPDSAALDVTGDLDLRVKVALDDWTPAAAQVLLGKRTAGQFSYQFIVNTNGLLSLYWSTTGSDQVTNFSNAAPTVADGATLWVRATLSVASNYAVNYYTSNDGLTWTQLGSTVSGTGATSIFAGTAPIEVGSIISGTASNARGKFFRAQVLNGINGTLAFDANFESSITSLTQTSFTESSTNGATVTINRSGSTYRSAGVIDAGYLYPGATNTFSNSTTDFLNMGANQDFTVVTVNRMWGTNSGYSTLLGKFNADTNDPGYNITTLISSSNVSFGAPDGTGKSTAFAQPYTSGNLSVYRGYRSGTTLGISLNTATPTTATGSTNSLSNVRNLRISSAGEIGSALYANTELYAAAVFRSALSAAQIRQISNYFANREAYL